MKKCLLILLIVAFAPVMVSAQQAPKRELRGTWIATYANIDWPKNRLEPVPLQRAALAAILDHHQATGINVIYFQIRSQCDAMYQSNLEPWSADLTGTQGKAPTELSMTDPSGTKLWDPLKYVIEECHRRGMELHAWMNPYRAINNYNVINSFAPNHVARQHPEWLLSQGTLRILDPGIPAAQAHIRRVVADVASRYDVDGIHFDDYFYPPQAAAGVTPYNDDATFAADPRGFTDRGDWRRDNVNRFIKSVSDTLKLVKPWIEFGVSPSGIYRNSTNPAIGSATSGLQHYVTLFADTRKWLQEGWIDYLAPQVYWYIGQPGANYSIIVPWWNNNAYGRHIYIGMAGYKVNDPVGGGPNWAIPTMIPSEVRINRSAANPNVYGQAIYNTSSLLSTTKLGFRDSLRTNFYKHPALQPQMPWRDDVAPDPASNLNAIRYGIDSTVLNWTAPTLVANEFDKVKRFVIYRSETPAIDFTNPANIVAITTSPVTHYLDKNLPKDTTYYYAITSLDRFHNESFPSNVTDYLPPVIACAPNQEAELNSECKFVIPDYSNLATVSDDVLPMAQITLTQTPAPGSVINGALNTLITLTATDASGKSTSCSFSVITSDKLAPVITARPEDIQVNTGDEASSCSVSVMWDEPQAIDNCNTPILHTTRSHAPGSQFSVGITKVTYVFKDESGNSDSTSFNITVVDDTKPVVVVKNITKSLEGGEALITPSEVDGGTIDNCGLATFALSKSIFTCADIGENIVTVTATDANGNVTTATVTVTITGTIPTPMIAVSRDNPVFTGLPENTLALGYGAQSLTLSAADLNNPFGSEYLWSPASGLNSTTSASVVFTASEEGDFNYAVEVTSPSGCTAGASVLVKVIDVRCGTRENKVQLCKTVGNQAVEMCVASQAVDMLLRTGSKLGSCQWSTSAGNETPSTAILNVYPNPFEQNLNVDFKLPVSDAHVRLDVLDVLGGSLLRVYEGATEAGQVHEFDFTTAQLRGRLILIRLTTAAGKVYYTTVMRK